MDRGDHAALIELARDGVERLGVVRRQLEDAGPALVRLGELVAPQLQAAMGALRDAAIARAALAAIRPCGTRIREAYARSAATLGELRPLSPELEARTGFASGRFLADHRRLATATVAYLGDVEALLDGMAVGRRAALPGLFAKARAGGVEPRHGMLRE